MGWEIPDKKIDLTDITSGSIRWDPKTNLAGSHPLTHCRGNGLQMDSFTPPKFPKSNMPHAHSLLLEGKPPSLQLSLIKRTIILLEIVVCLLLFPCYPHQSWFNRIYSCMCDVFKGTHSRVCVCAHAQRSEVDKQAFLITLHIIFFWNSLTEPIADLFRWVDWLVCPTEPPVPESPVARLKVLNAMPICSNT